MSRIEWTDTTWNPVIGCELASPGCALCYAAAMAGRQVAMAKGRGRRSPYADVVHVDEPGAKRRRGAGVWNGKTRFIPERLAVPLRWRAPRMVFAPSMSDFFHPTVAFEHVAAILGVMAATPRHTYQVLTKRPGRLLEFLRWLASQAVTVRGRGAIEGRALVASLTPHATPSQPRLLAAQTELAIAVEAMSWPLPNVWFGVSVEDQARADDRLPLLAGVRAQGWHTFVSAEPLIGPIASRQWGAAEWVIIGGESGSQARRCEGEWMRQILDDARRAGAAVFVKQLGLRFADRHRGVWGAGVAARKRCAPAVRRHTPHPNQLMKNRKGADISEWPRDLRVREWPAGMRDGLAADAERVVRQRTLAVGLAQTNPDADDRAGLPGDGPKGEGDSR